MVNAFFIDGNWCYGCHACEAACRQERGFKDADQCGIQVFQMGVWDYQDAHGEEQWQHTYYPLPTDQCELCVGSSHQGDRPICATVCGAQCLQIGDFDELSKKVTNPRQLVVRVR